jgi:hypothetical protein
MQIQDDASASKKPIVIYLDSQDYSRLADPPPNKVQFYQELDAQLSGLVASGEIEIRYSAAHISELSHTSNSVTHHSARRAQVLNRLSQGKCLRFWTDILDNEITAALDPNKNVSFNRDHNQWFEFDFDGLSGFIHNLKNSLQQSLKEKGVSRKIRRAVGSVNLAHRLTKTADGLALLDKIVDQINSRYPLERELDRPTLAAYIAGTKGEKHFKEYMRGLMADPVSLISRIAPSFDKPLKLPAIIRDQGLILINDMNPSLEGMSKLLANLPHDLAFKAIWDDAATMPNTSARRIRLNAVRQRLSEMPGARRRRSRPVDDDTIDRMSLPTLDVLLGAFSLYLGEAISASKAGRPIRLFEKSDGGDLVHATYIPYVDIFRCDTAWADRFKRLSTRFNTTVVGRIEDLLPTIERLSRQRQSA